MEVEGPGGSDPPDLHSKPAASGIAVSDLAVVEAAAFRAASPPGKAFESKQALLSEANKVAAKFGFMVRLNGRAVECTRAGKKAKKEEDALGEEPQQKQEEARSGHTVTLRCSCCFRLNFAYVVGCFMADVGGEMVPVQADKYRLTPELEEVELLGTQDFLHSSGCAPSAQQPVVQQRKGSALFVKQSVAMPHILSTMSLSHKNLDTFVLRALLRQVSA